MKKTISGIYKLVNRFIEWIYRLVYLLYFNIVLKKGTNEEYEDLAPITDIDEVDKSKTYRTALDYALNNENIENIAIIGPYGSGKSSIIKSYLCYAGLSHKQYLTISLSTFINKETYFKKNDQKNHLANDDNTLVNQNISKKSIRPINELEASILEQILYSNEEKSHNFTRLKRINIPKKRKVIANFIMLIIFLLSISTAVDSRVNDIVIGIINSFTGLFGFEFEGIREIDSTFYRLVFTLIIGIVDASVLFKIYRQISSFTKINLSFSKVNLEFKSSNGESLLDKYIDEIFNFFKHNEYKIVIFEDLDRYQNIDIFERLKRINRLLNKSNHGKNKGIKFIYTIGDHMFDNERFTERTKFFDFVLPIIPIINSTNSISDLKLSFSKFELKDKLTEQLLKDVSFFIDDMRTLKNISNEFITYYKILSDPEDANFANKLFAIICYKNRYPNDFSEFQNNKGFVSDLIERCQKLRTELVHNIDNNIVLVEKRINNFEQEVAKSVQEIIDIYKMYLYRRIGYSSTLYVYDKKNTRQIKTFNRDQILNMSNLDEIFGDFNIKIRSSMVNISELRTLGGTSEDIDERIDFVKLKKKSELSILRNELKGLRQSRDIVQYSNLATILNDNIDDPEVVKFQNSYPMLFYFFIHSYIGKDYHKYIGHFKEGHMTTNDKSFLAHIKSKQNLNSNFSIDTPNVVIDELVTEDFYVESILNYSLIHYLLKKDDYRLQSILFKHKEKNDQIVKFLSGFVKWNKQNKNDGKLEIKLIKFLYYNFSDIGKYVFNNRQSIEEFDGNINDYFVATMIEEMLDETSNNSNAFYFLEYIIVHNYLTKMLLFCDSKSLENILKMLSTGDKKVLHIGFFDDEMEGHSDFIDFIYINNLYVLTYKNIISILKRFIDNSIDYIDINIFFDILESEQLNSLKTYIEENGTAFIDKIIASFPNYSLLESKHVEFCINKLCNSIVDVEKVLGMVDESILIEKISRLNSEYFDIVVKEDRLVATYENVFNYIITLGTTPNLSDYIHRHVGDFERPDFELDNDMLMAYYSLLVVIEDDNVLRMLNDHFNDIKISSNALNSNNVKLKKLIKIGFETVIDENLIGLAKEDEELMALLITQQTDEVLASEIQIQVNNSVMKKIYAKMNFTKFKKVFNMQIKDNPDVNISEVINGFNEQDFLQYLQSIDEKDKKIKLTIDYIQDRITDKTFMIEVMIIIDVEYEDFKFKEHFSIEGNADIERLLSKFKEIGITNYKGTSTGKLEIWILKNRKDTI